MTDNPSKPNWAILGALRFLLAMVVVCNHLILVIPARELPASLHAFRLMDGFTAVFCFLIVSGFSIAASVEKDRDGFYQRRIRRLSPVYYGCLLWSIVPVAVAQNHLYDVAGHSMEIAFSSLPLTALSAIVGLNFIAVSSWPTFGQSWSLTCEIVYYAFAPILVRFKWLPVFAFIISLGLYFATPAIFWFEWPTLVIAPKLAWFWLMGWLLYQYRQRWLVHVVHGSILSCVYMIHNNGACIYAPVTLAITWAVFVIANHPRFSGLRMNFCDWLGDLSYPLYLSHVATMMLAVLLLPVSRHQPYLLLAFILAGAIAIRYGIEIPMHRRYRNNVLVWRLARLPTMSRILRLTPCRNSAQCVSPDESSPDFQAALSSTVPPHPSDAVEKYV